MFGWEKRFSAKYQDFSRSTMFMNTDTENYTVLRANQIQITEVSGWKRARTKTLFVITKIACEFHNSPTFTQRSDIVSCIWSSVFCISLPRQKGMGSNPSK